MNVSREWWRVAVAILSVLLIDGTQEGAFPFKYLRKCDEQARVNKI